MKSFFFNEIIRKVDDHPQPYPHPAGTVGFAIISPAGRPAPRRVARVLCDRDGLLLTRVRARSGALPVLGGSSSRFQLVDKSVELRARLPPSVDRLARELREDCEKP